MDMKKLLIMVILAMTVAGCEMLSPELWNRAEKRRKESGERCYESSNGTFYCEDKYGNRVD